MARLNHKRLLRCIEAGGPRPFITRRVYALPDGSRVYWHSRHHRKGLVLQELAKAETFGKLVMRSLWMPQQLNWWIGTVFALGSLLFMIASIFSLYPALARRLLPDNSWTNLIYFAGSIPFTTAAYLQLYQSANADPLPHEVSASREKSQLFGWRPRDIGWLSCALQFPGTVLFNFNTFDAMVPGLNWFQEDLVVWVPNFAGSVLFLLSGYLAFMEMCHGYWAWEPGLERCGEVCCHRTPDLRPVGRPPGTLRHLYEQLHRAHLDTGHH